MSDMPESDELVLATVKKILPYGAFCSLDEYGNRESFMHISEVAPRWIKNIHEFLHEGAHLVAKVYHVDLEKGQVDISLKRISEAEKKRKLETVRRVKRAQKLFEVALKEAKSTTGEAQAARAALDEKFGDLMDAFEQVSAGDKNVLDGLKIEKGLVKALLAVAQKSIRHAKAELRAILQLTAYSADGVTLVKETLTALKVPAECGLEILYLGAPRYQITVSAHDYKEAQKVIDSLHDELVQKAKKQDFAIEWEMIEE